MPKDLLEVIGEALSAYWTSPLPLIIVFACLACIGTLVYVFLTNSRNAKLRVSLLTGLYSLSIFFWLFLATSFVFCLGLSRMVAYAKFGVQVAAGSAVLVSFVVSAIVSLFVWRTAATRILRKTATREPLQDERWIVDYARLVGRFEGLPDFEVRITESPTPLAMTVSGPDHVVIVSTGLLHRLDRDEVEGVLTHELMHIKNNDSRFKVFSTVISRILFFDPFSKFFDPAVHREREYLADEASGRTTGKPAALASALVKIADFAVPTPPAAGLSITGKGKGVFSRYPPLKERVQRLLLLSGLLSGAGRETRKA